MLLRGLWLCDLLVNMEFVVTHGRATFIFHPLLSVVKIFIFSRFPQNKKARENQSKKSKFVMWNIFNASANNCMSLHLKMIFWKWIAEKRCEKCKQESISIL